MRFVVSEAIAFNSARRKNALHKHAGSLHSISEGLCRIADHKGEDPAPPIPRVRYGCEWLRASQSPREVVSV